MVNLTRIYTKTGDGGQTRLGTGQAVAKTDSRVEACGAVDELNAALGVALGESLNDPERQLLAGIQNDLFDLGADLSVPLSTPGQGRAPLRLEAVQVAALETAIDRLNGNLQPLRSFILPGGTRASAQLHVARTVCRRAERRAWALAEAAGAGEVNGEALRYLNRLSDLLFVLARAVNAAAGEADVLWRPGGEPEAGDGGGAAGDDAL